MAEISTILGIDYGKEKIGLSIADSETRMAFAFDMLKNDKDLVSKLSQIIKDENVEKIVIGYTKHEKDLMSVIEKESFSQKIENELGVKVFLHEEMFTTKMAQDNLKMHGKKGLAKNDDKEAARIILQSWLDLN
jgi:putative Holliday junction resolvase